MVLRRRGHGVGVGMHIGQIHGALCTKITGAPVSPYQLKGCDILQIWSPTTGGTCPYQSMGIEIRSISQKKKLKKVKRGQVGSWCCSL